MELCSLLFLPLPQQRKYKYVPAAPVKINKQYPQGSQPYPQPVLAMMEILSLFLQLCKDHENRHTTFTVPAAPAKILRKTQHFHCFCSSAKIMRTKQSGASSARTLQND